MKTKSEFLASFPFWNILSEQRDQSSREMQIVLHVRRRQALLSHEETKDSSHNDVKSCPLSLQCVAPSWIATLKGRVLSFPHEHWVCSFPTPLLLSGRSLCALYSGLLLCGLFLVQPVSVLVILRQECSLSSASPRCSYNFCIIRNTVPHSYSTLKNILGTASSGSECGQKAGSCGKA